MKKTEQKRSGYEELVNFYRLVSKKNIRYQDEIRKRFASIKNGNIIENTVPSKTNVIKSEPVNQETSLMDNAYENLRSQYEIIRRNSCRH